MGLALTSLHQDVKNLFYKIGIPIPGATEIKMVMKPSTAMQEYWRGKLPASHQFYSIKDAHDSCTSLQNEVILLPPEYIGHLATWAYSKYNTHLVGMSPLHFGQFHYCRFGASDNFTPVITQSSWASTWANLRVGHGRGDGGNLVGVSLTGHYNNWYNVHLYSPGNTTEGDVGATMMSLSLAGGNNYFEKCVLGVDTIQRSAANAVINVNTSGVCNIFKDCIIHMYQDASTPYLVWFGSGASVQNRWTMFDNCTFIAYSVNWATSLTTAFGYNYSGATGQRIILKDCGVIGVTDLIADGYENNVQIIGGNVYMDAATANGMPKVPET